MWSHSRIYRSAVTSGPTYITKMMMLIFSIIITRLYLYSVCLVCRILKNTYFKEHPWVIPPHSRFPWACCFAYWTKFEQVAFCNMAVFRRSLLEVFCKKGVLVKFPKFTGKHVHLSLFFKKVASLRPAILSKKRLWHRCFPVNFVKVLRTQSCTYFCQKHNMLKWVVHTTIKFFSYIFTQFSVIM